MKKKLALVLTAVFVLCLFAGCGKKDNSQTETTKAPEVTQEVSGNNDSQTQEPAGESETLKEKVDVAIGALKGPTALGMLKMMEDAEAGTAANNYKFTIAGAADEITASIIKGDIPIAAVPCNLASVLYNKSKGGVTMLGINTLGVLYIVETGETVQTVEDLRGKTIYSTGKGTTPEYTLNQLLKSAGMEPGKDVTVEYKSEATEVATILSQAENAVAMLPQPYVTTVLNSNEKARIALDVAKEWETLNPGTTVVTGVVVANTKYLTENPDVVNAFMDEYVVSAAYTVEQVEEAAALAEKFDIFKAAIAKKAIPYCNIVLMEGNEMQEKAAAYLQVLFEQNPSSVGGALPEESFYYKR
ncbi:MAG: ABC transporter substrate-binding protein [Lachnospiraceae bacterium]|nr:ABC transporter substrate-binding protein [Lachnospiraceae bacterium]